MMKILMLLCILLYSGFGVRASVYDYSATMKCLAEPGRAQYGGGMIVNPEFNRGLEGWTVFGEAAMKEVTSERGNKFIVAYNRTKSQDSFSQKVLLEKGKIYIFSAWIQVSRGSEIVVAKFKTPDGKLITGGSVLAQHGCWSLLKGGLVADFTGLVDIILETNKTTVEIWAGSISLQPFTKEQWRSHQEKNINKFRKRKVRFQFTCANKTSLEGAKVSIKQIKSGFPFGCGMNYRILTNKDYQNWFASRFKYTTFTNAMKWYSTEIIQGKENYTIADAMLKFCKKNGISVRGHNILWDNPKQQPSWVMKLSPEDLREAAAKRINSVTSRYAGQLIAWDVMNENLHFRFYEQMLGQNASAEYYKIAHQLDPNTTLFLNEFNTVEVPQEEKSYPLNYKKKIDEITAYPGNARLPLGIGLQGHFTAKHPNLAYMRSALDLLGSLGYPIWITELSIGIVPEQAQNLEDILREAHAHPAVKGIISFSGPAPAGFKEMPLTDEDFKNTPTGDVMDKMLHEWKSEAIHSTIHNAGSSEFLLYHGDYDITIKDPVTHAVLSSSNFKVTKDLPPRGTVNVRIDA